MRRLRQLGRELFDTDSPWPGPLRHVQPVWQMTAGIWICLMALVALALVAVAVYWLGGGAVEIVTRYPGSARAIGLELLGAAMVAVALAGVMDRFVPKVVGVVGWVFIVSVVAGALTFVYSADPRTAHRAPKAAHSFCDVHDCIPSFEQGNGFIVRCADGMWSYSGGAQGACSHDGGEF